VNKSKLSMINFGIEYKI